MSITDTYINQQHYAMKIVCKLIEAPNQLSYKAKNRREVASYMFGSNLFFYLYYKNM